MGKVNTQPTSAGCRRMRVSERERRVTLMAAVGADWISPLEGSGGVAQSWSGWVLPRSLHVPSNDAVEAHSSSSPPPPPSPVSRIVRFCGSSLSSLRLNALWEDHQLRAPPLLGRRSQAAAPAPHECAEAAARGEETQEVSDEGLSVLVAVAAPFRFEGMTLHGEWRPAVVRRLELGRRLLIPSSTWPEAPLRAREWGTLQALLEFSVLLLAKRVTASLIGILVFWVCGAIPAELA